MLQTIIRTIGFVIAVLMGLGAIFGAVNTMYIRGRQPHARDRDAARARLRQRPGRRVGDRRSRAPQPRRRRARRAARWVAFDGYQTATMNWQSFSQVAFAFTVTPRCWCRDDLRARHGLLGGLFPAIRAARLPVVTALRQL